jgi:dTDP-4-amino-4,6-dideoxygalactose transaminase
MKISMVDLKKQYSAIKDEVDNSIKEVIESTQFILGKKVSEFENACSQYLGAKYSIACASGTDALQIAMMAIGIKPGDEVITTPFTFVATAETIAILGATPVYVDIMRELIILILLKLKQQLLKRLKP